MILKIWNDKGIDGLNETILKIYAHKFWKGTIEGYGKDLVSVDYNTPDYNMLEQLQKNVWQFSGAKNYQQLRELSNALISPEGKMREYNEFKTIALSISDKYVKQYLPTEYNLAVAGGQMASKWVTIADNAAALPLLEFDAILDSQTTALCQGLNGTILPINHPFWNVYYPPNHYNCRSTVRQLSSGKVTAENKIPSADIPKMFRTNLAKQGLIFPEDHPYFIGIPQWVLDQSKPTK